MIWYDSHRRISPSPIIISLQIPDQYSRTFSLGAGRRRFINHKYTALHIRNGQVKLTSARGRSPKLRHSPPASARSPRGLGPEWCLADRYVSVIKTPAVNELRMYFYGIYSTGQLFHFLSKILQNFVEIEHSRLRFTGEWNTFLRQFVWTLNEKYSARIRFGWALANYAHNTPA